MTDDRHAHWQKVYTAKAETEVSWFQPRSEVSLGLIRAAAPDLAAGILDVGGGASRLVDELAGLGYSDLSVLDIAEAALERSRARLGTRAAQIGWIVADITQWQPPRRWYVWHDRAVFHFLTATEDQDAYFRALDRATVPGATAIVSTFALDGPERCSGLPVQRYDAAALAARLGAGFALVGERAEAHETPGGAVQKFVYAMFRKSK